MRKWLWFCWVLNIKYAVPLILLLFMGVGNIPYAAPNPYPNSSPCCPIADSTASSIKPIVLIKQTLRSVLFAWTRAQTHTVAREDIKHLYGGHPVVYQFLAGVLPVALVLFFPLLSLFWPDGLGCCRVGDASPSRLRVRILRRSYTFSGRSSNPFPSESPQVQSTHQCDAAPTYPFMDELKCVMKERVRRGDAPRSPPG